MRGTFNSASISRAHQSLKLFIGERKVSVVPVYVYGGNIFDPVFTFPLINLLVSYDCYSNGNQTEKTIDNSWYGI